MNLDTVDKYLSYLSKNGSVISYGIPTNMDCDQYKSQYVKKLQECKNLSIEDINLLLGNTVFKLESTSYGICNIITHIFTGYVNFWLSYNTYEIRCIMKNPCVYSSLEYTFRDLYNKSIALEVLDYGTKSRFNILGITNMDILPDRLYIKENVLVDMSSNY